MGTAITATSPSTSATDIAGYTATGLPPAQQIDTATGGISGTPTTANGSTQDATVTLTEDTGNTAGVTDHVSGGGQG